MNSATPIKRKPSKPDHIEQCVKDMRKTYSNLSESQLLGMLEKKYKIPWNKAKAILAMEG